MLLRKRVFGAIILAVALACAIPSFAWAASSDSLTVATASSSALRADAKAAAPQVRYAVFQNGKWAVPWKSQGKTSGKAGSMVQFVKAQVVQGNLSGSVSYRTYSKYKGWLAWGSNGKAVGIKGWQMRGVQAKLTGKLGKAYDIVYRVCLEDDGWQPWVVNGVTAGSTGSLGRVEQLQMKIVRKGSTVKVCDGAYFITAARSTDFTLQVPKSSQKKNVQLVQASFGQRSFSERFYVRNTKYGTVLLQSCVSGLYLCEVDGKVVQRPRVASRAYHWRLSGFNGGYAITNGDTGRRLKLENRRAVTSDRGNSWVFTSADVVPEGLFTLSHVGLDRYLAVAGEELGNGAKLWVQGKDGVKAEVFRFSRVASSAYRITGYESGKRVEVKSGSVAESALVWQNAASSSSRQKWKVSFEPNGSFALTNVASGKVLTTSGGDGSYAKSCTDEGFAGQRWKFTYLSSSQAKALDSNASPEAIAEQRASGFAKSATSMTNYFITVDLTNHWVCIFKGPKGGRYLLKSWPASTGRPDSPTPTGEYTTGYKQYEFGTGYSCYYATAFIGYVYLFHSVKYYKDTFTVMDGRLGQPVSDGCVRLAIGNAKWIYNNIPSGTKVKIYY